MQSSTTSSPAQRTIYRRDRYGATSISVDNGSAGDPTSYICRFDVSNGSVGNNRTSPTAMAFTKLTTSGSLRQFNRLSGHPFSEYTEITDPTYKFSDPYATGITYGASPNFQGLYEDALQGIFDQIRYGSGNLVVDLAESRETIKMIKNATSVRKTVGNVLKSVTTKKRYSSADAQKYASDKWLEYRYGWLPFVSSTYELLETLSKKVDKATIVALDARRGRSDFSPSQSYSEPGQYNTRYVKREISDSARVLLKVRMRARNTLDISDFTSLNPAGIAWELLPLSFIVDWFVTVGATLQLWEDYILFADRFVDGFLTQTHLERMTYSRDEYWYVNPPLWPVDGQQKNGFAYEFKQTLRGQREYKKKSRYVLSALPLPGGPRVEVKLGAKRILDAAALLRGPIEKLFKGK